MTVKRWPLFLIAAPAAVAVWSGWVGLGGMAGFGIIHPLPGIASSFKLNTAITLPIGVEAYGSYAMAAWFASTGVNASARRFARNSSIGSLALGMLGQVAYHLLAAAHVVTAPWPVTMLVACLPVVSLGFGMALAHLLHVSESHADRLPEVAVANDLTADNGADTDMEGPGTRTWNINHAKARTQLKVNPSLTGKELAEMIGTSDRHARRILSEVRDGLPVDRRGVA